jgi:hypothetical protein
VMTYSLSIFCVFDLCLRPSRNKIPWGIDVFRSNPRRQHED